MKKPERKQLYKLAKHYKHTIDINNERIRQFRIIGKRIEADALDHKLIGIGQYHSDFLQMLRALKLSYEELENEFEADLKPKTPRMKKTKM